MSDFGHWRISSSMWHGHMSHQPRSLGMARSLTCYPLLLLLLLLLLQPLGGPATTAQVHPYKLTHALMSAAQQAGCTLRHGQVEGVLLSEGSAAVQGGARSAQCKVGHAARSCLQAAPECASCSYVMEGGLAFGVSLMSTSRTAHLAACFCAAHLAACCCAAHLAACCCAAAAATSSCSTTHGWCMHTAQTLLTQSVRR